MQKHNKLAAIMFNDIVGYTALMAKDEENALCILQKHRDVTKLLVSQFNGEWLKEMGDGTLSSFSSVIDAVNCALEIQHFLLHETEFKIRIGIHVGDIVVEGGKRVRIGYRIHRLLIVCVKDNVIYLVFVYENTQGKDDGK